MTNLLGARAGTPAEVRAKRTTRQAMRTGWRCSTACTTAMPAGGTWRRCTCSTPRCGLLTALQGAKHTRRPRYADGLRLHGDHHPSAMTQLFPSLLTQTCAEDYDHAQWPMHEQRMPPFTREAQAWIWHRQNPPRENCSTSKYLLADNIVQQVRALVRHAVIPRPPIRHHGSHTRLCSDSTLIPALDHLCPPRLQQRCAIGRWLPIPRPFPPTFSIH